MITNFSNVKTILFQMVTNISNVETIMFSNGY